MLIQEGQSRIETGKTGWISISIDESQPAIDFGSNNSENPQRKMPMPAPAVCHLFEHIQEIQTPLPERFPRLTFLAIAVALLASALAAEFDYLHGAGYYWP